MKIPTIWITLGKRGFSFNDFKQLRDDDHISFLRFNTGRSSFDWIVNAIHELISIGFPEDKILIDIGNTKPRLRVNWENGIEIHVGETITISKVNDATLYLNNENFFHVVAIGDIIYFGDGEIECSVSSIDDQGVTLSAVSDGVITNGVAIGIKGKEFFHFYIDDNQIKAINDILANNHVGLILSFVETVNDIKWARSVFNKASIIIPKIETVSAIENIDSILSEVPAIFIGRGDLALSVGIERVGIVQRELITKAKSATCAISVGTGTLDSLKWSQIPLRAEIVDITNSVLMGVDYIALTSETGGSTKPFESVKYLERTLDYLSHIE